jgi:hypothetical protein
MGYAVIVLLWVVLPLKDGKVMTIRTDALIIIVYKRYNDSYMPN